ncbi:MAG: nitrate ABC transporter permease, partial [Acutalibacteraceae bacterium]|nr:nitrate ABC transporter permease [Acutalibacteraceae bacterium]
MPKKHKRPGKIKLWSVAIWLIIWQICALIIGQNILLVSPVTAFQRLFELACTGEFWLSITFSLLRIIGGFLAACIAGILLAALSAKFKYVEQFLAPFMLTVKA